MKNSKFFLGMLLGTILFGSGAISSHAAGPTVEIQSFYYTNPQPNKTAEICGVVRGQFPSNARVQIVVDPGNQAGSYVSWPTAEGNWCSLLNTVTGRVTVSLWSGKNQLGAEAVRSIR